MIAAKHERHRALLQRHERRLIQLLTHFRDVADVFLSLVAPLLRFGNGRRQIAFVDRRVAESGDSLAEAGDAEGGRSHVDAAAVGAEIERHADDVDGTHGENPSP